MKSDRLYILCIEQNKLLKKYTTMECTEKYKKVIYK